MGKVWCLQPDLIIQRLLEILEAALSKDSEVQKDDYLPISTFAQISGLSHLSLATQHDQGDTLESQEAFTQEA